jgi:LacI family transcriptional regulator
VFAKTSTLEQIAAEAGVSHATVSRVLTGRLNPTRRAAVHRADRIRSIAARLGYRPNAAARVTRSGHFGTVALLLSTKRERSNVAADLLNGIADVLSERGQKLMVVRLPDDQLTDRGALPSILREHATDGLLIDYTHAIPDALVQLIDRLPVPAVWINSKQSTNCVRPDDRSAGRRAVEILVGLGHRRIAYADFGRPDFETQHYSVADRLAGYRDGMADAGLQPLILGAPTGPEIRGGDRVAYARQVLDVSKPPTAAICHSHKSSIPLQMAAAVLGRQVPRDLSLIAFEDHPVDFLGPCHTTLCVPHAEVGRRAAAMLLDRIAKPGVAGPEITIPFELLTGETIRPPVRSGDRETRAQRRTHTKEKP